jgi:hypothetical protein
MSALNRFPFPFLSCLDWGKGFQRGKNRIEKAEGRGVSLGEECDAAAGGGAIDKSETLTNLKSGAVSSLCAALSQHGARNWHGTHCFHLFHRWTSRAVFRLAVISFIFIRLDPFPRSIFLRKTAFLGFSFTFFISGFCSCSLTCLLC